MRYPCVSVQPQGDVKLAEDEQKKFLEACKNPALNGRLCVGSTCDIAHTCIILLWCMYLLLSQSHDLSEVVPPGLSQATILWIYLCVLIWCGGNNPCDICRLHNNLMYADEGPCVLKVAEAMLDGVYSSERLC